MIRRGRAKLRGAPVGWVLADLNRLPLALGTADAVTAAYALRYCVALPAFFARCHALLRAGGVFWAFDLGKPRQPVLHALWVAYLAVTGALLGTFLHGNPATYFHLVETLRAYPGQRRVAALLGEAGFQDVRCVELLGGALAIHVARK
jgi:demethylmenaquinone methyltransferase/2-methoxy-6-polyprenyl-1,4-benzoquinol methylase